MPVTVNGVQIPGHFQDPRLRKEFQRHGVARLNSVGMSPLRCRQILALDETLLVQTLVLDLAHVQRVALHDVGLMFPNETPRQILAIAASFDETMP